MFLDFANAFDIVDHRILLSKLQNYGIRGIAKDLFESYLTNHKQVVKIGNILSEQKFITCGVSHWSTLGPILFLQYINDIKNSSKILFNCWWHSSTLIINKKVEEIQMKNYNGELRHVSEWLNATLSKMSNKNNRQTWHKGHRGTHKRKGLCQILGCVNWKNTFLDIPHEPC